MGFQVVENLVNRSSDETNDVYDGMVFSDSKRSITKEYLNGRVNLHVHVRFEAEEYCAIFDRSIEVPSLGDFSTCPTQVQFLPEASSGEQKVSMLISVTKFMEIPEIPPAVVRQRAVAWLKRIYDGNYCVGHPFELTPLITIVFGDVDKDRELIAECELLPLRQNQLPNKMVEGTPEVVQHFPDTQAEVAGYGRHVSEAVDLISRCVIDIFGDSIEFEVVEGQQISAQSLTLFFGPVKFSKRTIE